MQLKLNSWVLGNFLQILALIAELIEDRVQFWGIFSAQYQGILGKFILFHYYLMSPGIV